MTISIVRFIPAAILIVLGLFIMALQTFGIFRIKYALNRMHSAAMGDSLGILLIAAGVAIIYGFSLSTVKLLSIVALFWFASPVCSHLLAKLEASTNARLSDDCQLPEEGLLGDQASQIDSEDKEV